MFFFGFFTGLGSGGRCSGCLLLLVYMFSVFVFLGGRLVFCFFFYFVGGLLWCSCWFLLLGGWVSVVFPGVVCCFWCFGFLVLVTRPLGRVTVFTGVGVRGFSTFFFRSSFRFFWVCRLGGG